MDGELRRLGNVWSLATTALLYCYYIASRFPKGTLRLIAILPVICLFIILPLQLTSFHFCSITFILLLCLANIKLLLFAFDKPPLSPLPSNAFIFIALASLPIEITLEKHNTKTKTTFNPPNYYLPTYFSLPLALLLLALSLYSFVNYKNQMHPLVLLFVCGCLLFIEINIVLAVSEVVARAILGYQILPVHNHPYLSTSLQDFWGRRWNPLINNVLRTIVFDPMRTISNPIIGSKSAPVAASLVTFVVSGVLHEVLYFYLTRASPSWEVTCFFVLNGVCVIIEVAVKRALRGRWRLHQAISGSLTMAFLAVTGFWLFLPQVIRDGMDTKIIRECSTLVTILTDKKNNFMMNMS